MIEITYDSAVTGLEAIVAEQGEDFVYPWKAGRCMYVHNGQPDCIVGRFLASVGVPLERLARADYGRPPQGTAAGNLILQLQSEGVVSTDGAVKGLLQAVQAKQDDGDSWGEALEYALSR